MPMFDNDAVNDSSTGAGMRAEQHQQTVLALGSMLVPLFFAIMFSACIIGAYHKPHPNHIRVGVVVWAARTAALRAGLEKAAGSAFEIRPAATVATAVRK